MTAASPPSPPEVSVPELGPLLGRITRLGDNNSAVPGLAPLRLEMMTELFEAAGCARQASVEKGIEEARSALAHQVWLGVFRATARKAAADTLGEVDRRLEAARQRSAMPSRRFRKLAPTDEDRQIIVNRGVAAGIPLERVTPPESLPLVRWNDGIRHTASALEESWDRLEHVMTEELVVWSMTAYRIGAWRRPPSVLWWTVALLALAALALGLSVGGYLPAPGPLAEVRGWWWSLPWP